MIVNLSVVGRSILAHPGVKRTAPNCQSDPIDGALATYDRGDYAVLHEARRRWLLELVAIVGYDALPRDLKEWLGPVGDA